MGITQLTWDLEFKEYLEEQFKKGESYRSIALKLGVDDSSLRIKIISLGWNTEYEKYQERKRKKDEERRFDKKLRYYPSSELPHTRAYLIENLKKNPKFKTNKGIILKEDFIEQYYKSREESGERVFNYDFSQLPDIIPSRTTPVPVFVNEISTKTGKLVGEWKTCYKSLVTLLEDNRICAGMVSKTKTAQYIDTEEFIRRSKERFGDDKFDYSKLVYINNHTPIKLRCLRCGKWFEQMPTEHIYGTGYCPDCAMEVCGIVKRKSNEDFIAELIEVFGEDAFDFSETEYIDSQHPVIVKDKATGITYKRYPSALLDGLDPRCKDSRGEMYIKEWLLDNNIEFDSEVLQRNIFQENKLGVYIDFVILESSVWIEYNGIQHYRYYKGSFHGITVDLYKKQLRRDRAIVDYCTENNIRLITIPFTYNTKEKIFEVLNRTILNKEGTDFIEYPEIEEVDYEE